MPDLDASSPRTQIRRLPHRAVSDRALIDSILDEGLVCHAAYVTEEGRPIVIPTLYVRDGDRVLLHGSNSMGLSRAVRHRSPLSVAVTHLDGLVVAKSAFESSANYRSVVLHGFGSLVTDQESKRHALELITERLIPGRLADVRPSSDQELGQTSVIALGLEEISAKVRTGGPDDKPEDKESPVWSGVIPLQFVAAPPIPADDLDPDIDLPPYIEHFTPARTQRAPD